MILYIYIYIYIYLKKSTIEANLHSTINKVKVAGFFIPNTHMAFRLILFSELTSGKERIKQHIPPNIATRKSNQADSAIFFRNLVQFVE